MFSMLIVWIHIPAAMFRIGETLLLAAADPFIPRFHSSLR